MSRDVVAIVPTAGAGQRFGGRTAKPFVQLDGKPLLVHTLLALQASAIVRWIIPVVRAQDVGRVKTLIARYRISKALNPCIGGSSRAASVAHGLAIVPVQARWVLIHDGARPCVSPTLIRRVVQAAVRHGAVACGLPASLTVKAVDERGEVRLTLDRDQLWFVQTPQVFRRDWFAQALSYLNHELGQFPDDAAIVEAAGFPVRMVPGEPTNIKVTTTDDLLLAEAILSSRTQRTKVKIQKSKVKTTTQHSKFQPVLR